MKCFLPDAAATQALAARIAAALPGQEQPLFIALRGELGAGKTTFVQGFLAALGVAGSVRSPTYALVEAYQAAGRQLVHADLYRLAAGGEFEALGLRELFVAGTVWLVEWPERAPGVLPPPDLALQFDVAADGRRCAIEATTVLGGQWLQAVATAGSGEHQVRDVSC